MQISAPLNFSLQIDSAPEGARSWRSGQILQALSLGSDAKGLARIRIGAQVFNARSSLPLPAGTPLSLKVVDNGETVQLRLMPPPPPESPVAAAVRAALPRQDSLGALFANLFAMARPTAATARPPAWAGAAAEVLARLPDRAQATNPRGLAQALRNSGLFLEAKLATGSGAGLPLVQDLKALLLNLKRALAGGRDAPVATRGRAQDAAVAAPRPGTGEPSPSPGAVYVPRPPPAPPLRGGQPRPQPRVQVRTEFNPAPAPVRQQLAGQVESALARVQLSQLASLPVAGGDGVQWLLELPVRGEGYADIFQLRLDQQQRQAESGGRPVWQVTLAFELPELGPVHARIRFDGEAVSTCFWSERGATADLFNGALEALRRDLRQAGLSVGELVCRHGVYPGATSVADAGPVIRERI